MCFEPLFGINYQGMPGFETVILRSNKTLMQAEPYDHTAGADIPPNSVGMLYYDNLAATAWITDLIAPSLTFEFENGDKFDAVAIAATTAHTTFLKGSYPAVWKFFTESIPNTRRYGNYIAVSLIDFIDESQDPRDPINGNSYSIPGDVMLFLILKRFPLTPGLSSLKPAQSPICRNLPINIFGYPFYTSLNLVYPLNCKVKMSEREVKKAICEGSRLVKSEGIVKEIGEMHAVGCTTAGGMSGSPAIIVENGVPRVAGILCGGPAAPLHRTFVEMVYAIQQIDWNRAEGIFNYLQTHANLNSLFGREEVLKLEQEVFARKSFAQDIIFDMYSNLLSIYASQVDETLVNHNLILPITSDCFRRAIYCSNQLANDQTLHGMTVTYGELHAKLMKYKSA